MLRFALNGRGTLGDRNRQSGRKIGRRIEKAAVSREAADSDELSGLAGECFSDNPDASVSRDHDVECAPRDCVIKRLAKMRIGMDVFNLGSDLRNLMRPTM